MVDGISSITDDGVSVEFVGLILLPIVGNAAEHCTAVTVAIRGECGRTVSIDIVPRGPSDHPPTAIARLVDGQGRHNPKLGWLSKSFLYLLLSFWLTIFPDKMDLAIGVAVGSSMQVSLLVIPLMVVLGWIMGKDDMTLAFDGFQIAIVFVAVLLVNYLSKFYALCDVILLANVMSRDSC
jgi:hypothetical protein